VDDRLWHRAVSAPLPLWQRVLGLEGCAVQLDNALATFGLTGELPMSVREMLRHATTVALHRARLVQAQLTELAALSAAHGVRVLALKGAARLLGGECPGSRSISDIDILVAPADAARWHCLVQSELGYTASGHAYSHHLRGLTRTGSLGIEVHTQLSRAPLDLDVAIWRDSRTLSLGGHAIEIPSPTAMVLHALEHAIDLNWAGRYRLRDIVDVASLYDDREVSASVVDYVRASSTRHAFEILLSAAHDLEPRVPCMRRRAWRTIALASLPRRARVAERWYRYAGMVAEGSPRTLARAGLALVRRFATAALGIALPFTVGCSEPSASRPVDVPPFVFVSDADGISALFHFDGGHLVRLSSPGHEDLEPHSAAGRIVFTSMRDGNAEIYIADLALDDELRLTNDASTDDEPALDPSGTTVAFVSSRSGTPRIWLMDADGANSRALETGSAAHVPEASPAWSPAGDEIAFTSTRTNTSQVFVVAASGGEAVQLSHEASGAFVPIWNAAGDAVLYTTLGDGPRLMAVPAAGGEATIFASGAGAGAGGVGDGTCAPGFCLAVSGLLDANGDLVAVRAGEGPQHVLVRPADDRQPAFLVP
jgi:hypothetical protein